MFVATEHVFCRDKSMLAATNYCRAQIILSRQTLQNYVCHDKHTFIAPKDVLSRQTRVSTKHVFVATIVSLSRQNHVWCDKHTFVAPKDVSCRYKDVFVATKMMGAGIAQWLECRTRD